MTGTTEDRLAKLEAIEDIRTVIGTYAYGGDRKNDPKILGPLFTEDAVWEAEGFGRYEGRKNIVEGLSEIAREKVLWSLHFPASPMITVDVQGDKATVYWWLWELSTLRTDDGGEESAFMGGTYDASLIKAGDQWLFTHVNLKMQTITPFKDGWNLITPS